MEKTKILTIREEDGYVNATKLCKAGGKKYNAWSTRKKTTQLISFLSKELKMEEKELIKKELKGKNENRAVWVHTSIATNIACWVSIEFGCKVCLWIEDWIKLPKNKQKYIEAIDNITKEDILMGKEKEIQEDIFYFFEDIIKVKIEKEVQTDVGYIDLLTDDHIIEIKISNNWKHALGQILSYGTFYPNHKKIILLYSVNDKDDIIYNKTQNVDNFKPDDKIYSKITTYDEKDHKWETFDVVDNIKNICKKYNVEIIPWYQYIKMQALKNKFDFIKCYNCSNLEKLNYNALKYNYVYQLISKNIYKNSISIDTLVKNYYKKCVDNNINLEDHSKVERYMFMS